MSMRMTKPLAERFYLASTELMAAMKENVDAASLADLQERYAQAQQAVIDNEKTQASLEAYRTAAFSGYHEDGHLEVDEEAVVSESEGGVYVEAWIWVDQLEMTNEPVC